MKLTNNFDSKEFVCGCGCGRSLMSPKFMAMLQKMRDLYGGPLVITSGYRCNNWNMKVGGAKLSQHMYGNAADISSVLSDDRYRMIKAAFEAGFTGIGINGSFVHVDLRRGDPHLWLY